MSVSPQDFAHLVVRASGNTGKKVDIRVADADGNVVVWIRDLWLRRWPSAEPDRPADPGTSPEWVTATPRTCPRGSGGGGYRRNHAHPGPRTRRWSAAQPVRARVAAAPRHAVRVGGRVRRGRCGRRRRGAGSGADARAFRPPAVAGVVAQARERLGIGAGGSGRAAVTRPASERADREAPAGRCRRSAGDGRTA